MMIVAAIILLPFAPILYGSYLVFQFVKMQYEIHDLFCGAIAAVPAILAFWLLLRSKIVRYFYFGIEDIILAAAVFYFSSQKTDVIWSSFFAAIALVIGLLLTRFVAGLSFDD